VGGVTSSRDVIIRTERWDEALRFYETVLGFAVASRSPGMAGFDTGALRLFVERGPAHGPVFDFLVDDVSAARDRLVAGGCTVIEEDPAVPRCYLRDPFGMVFNLGRSASP
jgi:catechol 2,3-dioxygenase-like lactoylglutathione lyase family enzyme